MSVLQTFHPLEESGQHELSEELGFPKIPSNQYGELTGINLLFYIYQCSVEMLGPSQYPHGPAAMFWPPDFYSNTHIEL